jgi:hypothetical protein
VLTNRAARKDARGLAAFSAYRPSRAADQAFKAALRGELPGTSIGYSVVEQSGDVVARSMLREVSLCPVGGNKGAVVLRVGDRDVRTGLRAGDWRDPANPRLPTLDDVGATMGGSILSSTDSPRADSTLGTTDCRTDRAARQNRTIKRPALSDMRHRPQAQKMRAKAGAVRGSIGRAGHFSA